MYLLTNIEFVSGDMDIVVCCFLSCPFLTFQYYSDQICHQQLVVVMRYVYYAYRMTSYIVPLICAVLSTFMHTIVHMYQLDHIYCIGDILYYSLGKIVIIVFFLLVV